MSEERKRVLTIRLTDREFDAITRGSEAAYMCKSNFARAAILEKCAKVMNMESDDGH